MLNMMLGEVAPGGPGSGLYGLVVMTLLAVFLGGLMMDGHRNTSNSGSIPAT